MTREKSKAKKSSTVKFAGTLLKVIGITVAAGVALTALTDTVLSKATGKDEKENDEE